MTAIDPESAPPRAADLAPVLADLGLAAEDVAPLGAGGAPGARLARVAGAAGAAPLAAVGTELGAADVLLVFVAGRPTDAALAAWRNVLWPRVHVGVLYQCADGRIVRRTLQGSARVGETSLTGVVLAGRRRAHVLSPAATVEKFDGNAEGWDGAPGGPGYPHFRWMRRYVGRFASAPPGARILDFGCGAGWVGIEAARGVPGAALCAFDPSPEMVRIAERNARAAGVTDFTGRTGFGEAPPFPAQDEEPFELVLSSGVVSFSPDLEAWTDGLASTVKPGGTLVIGDIHGGSRGFRRRRRTRPLVPVRELNARTRDELRAALERRGFVHRRSAGYQLTWPVPQAMHLNETRLKGLLTWPLLWSNQAGAAVDRALGSPLQALFDSWVMHLERRG
jgi:SAM-dependent methyltransferase